MQHNNNNHKDDDEIKQYLQHSHLGKSRRKGNSRDMGAAAGAAEGQQQGQQRGSSRGSRGAAAGAEGAAATEPTTQPIAVATDTEQRNSALVATSVLDAGAAAAAAAVVDGPSRGRTNPTRTDIHPPAIEMSPARLLARLEEHQ